MLSRRDFFYSTLALSAAWPRRVSLAGMQRALRFSASPFSLGVASGDPSPDGMVLWTRLAPRPLTDDGGMPSRAVPVSWEVGTDDGLKHVVRRGTFLARPESVHAVHVEVGGLLPDRHY